mmetsp:Transcript_15362/g.43800  ORF Transcript_15362/g.43800 Transcript_15362/m.43800 type:complete len:256 (+) Transcript_15362:660-1427(+)
MSSGLTQASNSASVQWPRSVAAARRVVPSLWAFLAMLAALSYPMWGLSAVTSIRLSCKSFWILSSLALMPETQWSVNDSHASARRRTDLRRLAISMGLKTLSSKWPLEPPMDIALQLPMTWAQTIVSASHWVGLTLPGMMLEPGSFSGRESSPRPQRGPDPRNRISFPIFISETATVLRHPPMCTTASWAARASNLLGAVTNDLPVICETFSATASANPTLELSPVPTAVPPWASMRRCGSEAVTRSMPYSTWVA